MFRRVLESLSLLTFALLLTAQLGAAAYGIRAVRDVMEHAQHELDGVAHAER